MMKALNLSLRLNSGEREMLKRAAAAAQENQSEFIKNSIQLRIQNRQLAVKPKGMAELMDTFFIEPYHPLKVSKADAAEIEELSRKSAAGELEFDNGPKVKVLIPSRRRKSTALI
ncbi:MAG: hypothetical protein ACREKE_09095 [bacterium]